MKRLFAGAAAVIVAVGLAVPAHAADPTATAKEGPYGPVKFQDYGSCTNIWADVNLKTTYYVSAKSGDGTYDVRLHLSGSFSSLAGQAPGACDSGTDDGNLITDGVKGKMKQDLYLVVTGGRFNPRGKCDDTCGTDYTFTGVQNFVNAFFKGGGTWAFSATQLAHEVVSSKDDALCAKKWTLDYDPMTGAVSNAKGDIATTCSR